MNVKLNLFILLSREVGDNWPVRIQDAILEKAEGGKVMHIAVDRGSREGCVCKY